MSIASIIASAILTCSADAATDPDCLERSQVNPVFQRTASARRDVPAAGSRAARCAFSARHTVRPLALLEVYVRRSARRPAVTAGQLGAFGSSLKRVREALRGVRDDSERVCQLRLISGTGGAGRVRQRAGELRHVARLGVVAFPGRLLSGSLLKPGVHLGEAKAPVPIVGARRLIWHSVPDARVYPRDRAFQAICQRFTA